MRNVEKRPRSFAAIKRSRKMGTPARPAFRGRRARVPIFHERADAALPVNARLVRRSRAGHPVVLAWDEMLTKLGVLRLDAALYSMRQLNCEWSATLS
jgi:hypothetical protein